MGWHYTEAQIPASRGHWELYRKLRSKTTDPIRLPFEALILKRGWKGIELKRHVQCDSMLLYFEVRKQCLLNMDYKKIKSNHHFFAYGDVQVHAY